MFKKNLESTLKKTTIGAVAAAGVIGLYSPQRADSAVMNVYQGSFDEECAPYEPLDGPLSTCIGFDFENLPSGELDIRSELPKKDDVDFLAGSNWYNQEDNTASNLVNTQIGGGGDYIGFFAFEDSSIKNNSAYGAIALTNGNAGVINGVEDLFTGEQPLVSYYEKNHEQFPLSVNYEYKDSTQVSSPSTLALLGGGFIALGLGMRMYSRKANKYEEASSEDSN